GAAASMTGRGVAVMAGLGADLQPAGWRLTDSAGIDQRRARSLLAQDLDTWEEQTQGYAGWFKVQIAGPWTMAATVERPRGDKVLGDIGARRDLAQALAEGLRDHLADLRRRAGAAGGIVVQVDEPVLAAVLDGSVPTASGFHRHRSVEPAEASQALGWVLEAISESGGEPWVHSCAPEVPWNLVRGAGARGLVVDFSVLSAADYDQVAEALEAGESVALGVLPSTAPDQTPTDAEVTETVLRWLDMVGLDPDVVGDRLLLVPSCGLAAASPTWAQTSLTLLRQAASHLS
uniref:methionine synthase n=1 Tax=Nocardioides sp. TaxID=35761 RepID=UPI0035627519